MKRAFELTDLSRDHHHALVLARRCVRAAAEDVAAPGREAAWRAAKLAFSTELEPHFQVEERLLLPHLVSAGETELVGRTRSEHARLRELIAQDADRAALQEFGELLSAHVRFEEKVLFVRAERVLSADQLAAVADASAALETAKKRVADAG